MTCNLTNGSVNSGITRCGYYETSNGFFFQLSNGNISVVLRSKVSGSVVDTVIS